MCNAHILVYCENMGVFPYCELKVSIFSSPFFKVNFTGFDPKYSLCSVSKRNMKTYSPSGSGSSCRTGSLSNVNGSPSTCVLPSALTKIGVTVSPA